MESHMKGRKHNYVQKRTKKESRDEALKRSSTCQYFSPGIVKRSGKFHCTICDCPCTSLATVADHIRGMRHLQNAKKKKAPGWNVSWLAKNVRNYSPIVGLDFIVEYFNEDDPEMLRFYACLTCSKKCHQGSIIRHVRSFKHRLNVLRALDLEAYKKLAAQKRSPSKIADDARLAAQSLEKEHGRGHPTVKPMPSDIYEMLNNASDDDTERKKDKSTLEESSIDDNVVSNDTIDMEELHVIDTVEMSDEEEGEEVFPSTCEELHDEASAEKSGESESVPMELCQEDSPTNSICRPSVFETQDAIQAIKNFEVRNRGDLDFVLGVIASLSRNVLTFTLQDMPPKIKQVVMNNLSRRHIKELSHAKSNFENSGCGSPNKVRKLSSDHIPKNIAAPKPRSSPKKYETLHLENKILNKNNPIQKPDGTLFFLNKAFGGFFDSSEPQENLNPSSNLWGNELVKSQMRLPSPTVIKNVPPPPLLPLPEPPPLPPPPNVCTTPPPPPPEDEPTSGHKIQTKISYHRPRRQPEPQQPVDVPCWEHPPFGLLPSSPFVPEGWYNPFGTCVQPFGWLNPFPPPF